MYEHTLRIHSRDGNPYTYYTINAQLLQAVPKKINIFKEKHPYDRNHTDA